MPVLLAVAAGLWRVSVSGKIELDECIIAAVMIVAVVTRQLAYTRELSATAEQHRKAAAQDLLTGLASRQEFLARLAEHLSTPGAGRAAVLLGDLDGFKEVNDQFGHHMGDRVLCTFADALKSAAHGHLAARLGGDEFAVLVVTEDPIATARDIARRVETGQAAPGMSMNWSCSIGIAELLPLDQPVEALRRADQAMYVAKRSSEPGAAVFDEGMARSTERRNLIVALLEGADQRGELSLRYQPLYGLADGEIAGAEALLRWSHPLLGNIPPDEFIPIAEDCGQIRRIGSWVLKSAIAQTAAWQRAGRYLPLLFVNVAGSQFTADLAPTIAQLLAEHDLPAERLIVEITETQMPALAVNASMLALRATGVHVAMDDFGSGYSSLAQISRLPVDFLKIDRDFVRNLDADNGRAVMDSVVGLAKALGLRTIAEGIEDLSQAAEVSNAGVDFAQGYLFARPLTPSDLYERLPLIEQPAVPGPRPESAAMDDQVRQETTR